MTSLALCREYLSYTHAQKCGGEAAEKHTRMISETMAKVLFLSFVCLALVAAAEGKES